MKPANVMDGKDKPSQRNNKGRVQTNISSVVFGMGFQLEKRRVANRDLPLK